MIILFLVLYIIIFGLYKLYFYIRRNSKEKTAEVIYLESKYKIKFKKKDMKKLNNYIALINSFIFVTTAFIMRAIDNIFIKFLTAFICIMVLIIILYKLLSLKYTKKSGK